MALLDRALELISAGRGEDGLRILGELIDSGESVEQALGHRAYYYRASGEYASAAADYEKLIPLVPSDPTMLAYYADVKSRLGDHTNAIGIAARALTLDPHNRLASDVIRASQEALGGAVAPPPIIDANAVTPARAINPIIQKMESDPASFPGSVFPEVGRVLYTLVRMIRPTLIFETGTYLGYSGLCMAQALEDIGAGHLHCFDLFPEDAEYVSPVFGPMRDNLKLVDRHFDAAGLRHRVTFHRGDSPAEMRKVAAELRAPVQFAFIDGDHTIKGCAKDWEVVDSLLPAGGIIVLHDTQPDRCGWLGPRYLLETLKAKNPQAYQLVNLPTGEGFGLGLMQKSGEDTTKLDWFPSIGEMLGEAVHLRHAGKRRWLPFG